MVAQAVRNDELEPSGHRPPDPGLDRLNAAPLRVERPEHRVQRRGACRTGGPADDHQTGRRLNRVADRLQRRSVVADPIESDRRTDALQDADERGRAAVATPERELEAVPAAQRGPSGIGRPRGFGAHRALRRTHRSGGAGQVRAASGKRAQRIEHCRRKFGQLSSRAVKARAGECAGGAGAKPQVAGAERGRPGQQRGQQRPRFRIRRRR